MFQQLIINGNLGKAPELRYTQSGTPVCSFDVAVKDAWTNDQGQRQEETTWYRVTAWRKQAETCAQYLERGSQVLVTGKVKAHPYTGRDGTLGASLEVKADTIRFLDRKRDRDGQGDGGQNWGQQPGQPSQQTGQATYEEDIPF